MFSPPCHTGYYDPKTPLNNSQQNIDVDTTKYDFPADFEKIKFKNYPSKKKRSFSEERFEKQNNYCTVS